MQTYRKYGRNFSEISTLLFISIVYNIIKRNQKDFIIRGF